MNFLIDENLSPSIVQRLAAKGVPASRDEQWAWVEPVVDWLLGRREPLVNEAVVVTGPGKFECVRLSK